jgi:PAS domain S-box-containing protein/putative nucleotidyltransferase with HDIG domain
MTRALRTAGKAVERRRSARDTAASERLYRDIYFLNPQPMWVFDLDTLRILSVNDAAVAHYGWSREEFSAMSIADIRPAGDARRLRTEIDGERAAAVVNAGPWTHCTKDGRTLDVEVTTIPVEYGGRPAWVVVARDVTSLRRSEIELKKSERRFRAVLEQSLAATYVIQDGRLVYLNPRMRQIFGYGPDDAFDPDPLVHVKEADRSTVVDQMQRRLSGEGDAAYSITALRKDGSEFTLGIHAGWAEFEGKPAIIASARDITEKVRYERELAFNSAILRTQQEASLDAILIVDEKQTIVSYNRQFIELWNIPGEVIESRSDQRAIHSVLDNFESPAEFTKVLQELYADRARTLRDELTLKDGRIIDRYTAPLDGSDGAYLGRAFYFRDVTKQKRTEETLRQALVATVEAIAATVEARDPYTAGHQRRAAELTEAIAREMGLPAKAVEGIRYGALIHDLGKVQIPSELLSKPTRLSRAEFDLIKTHPQAGYDIVKNIKFPWPVAVMVHQHHERLDGSGYPQGLKGDAIALEARILAVADVVEAMASHRPYRAGLGIDVALKEIESKRGLWFDPAAVDACLRLFREKGYTLTG